MNSIFPSTESLCNFFSYTILSCHDSVSIGVHWDSQETTEDALVCSAYVRVTSSYLKSTHSQKVTLVKTLEVLLNSSALIGV